MMIITIVAAVFALSSFVGVYFKNNEHVSRIFIDSYSDFNNNWLNEYNIGFNVSDLAVRNIDFDTETPLRLHKTIPDFHGEFSLFFRTNNLVVNVYIDDEPVSFVSDNGYYNDLSSFSAYYKIPVFESDIGKTVTLEMYKTPASGVFGIDKFYFGSSGNITYSMFIFDSGIIVTGILVIIAGIIFLWMGIVCRKVYEHYCGLIYFGIFSVLIGLWFLTDTYWFYNGFNSVRIIEISSHLFLTACVPCFMMYIYDFFGINRKKIYMSITALGFVLSVLLFVLNAVGVFTYGYSNPIIHIYIAACGVILLIEMISYLANIAGIKGESKVFNLGVVFFVIFGLLDMGRFYQGNQGNSSQFVRFGYFILVVTTVAIITRDIVELLKLGIQAGKIGKIAFTDANTGLGNPAAFKNKFEELDRLKNNYSYIGIIQFDVNNLKIINDNLGHEAGDLLIKTAAEMIDSTFGKIGSCYRVGGDEFVAITTYNHAPLACEDAIMKFERTIEQFNKNPNKPFDLRIAYGVAYYCNDSHQFQSLKEVHKLADQRMYDKKKELKARFSKTPEEAIIR